MVSDMLGQLSQVALLNIYRGYQQENFFVSNKFGKYVQQNEYISPTELLPSSNVLMHMTV